MAELKDIDLTVDVLPHSAPNGDRILLQNAVSNILDNAIKILAARQCDSAILAEADAQNPDPACADGGPAFPMAAKTTARPLLHAGQNRERTVGSGLGLDNRGRVGARPRCGRLEHLAIQPRMCAWCPLSLPLSLGVTALAHMLRDRGPNPLPQDGPNTLRVSPRRYRLFRRHWCALFHGAKSRRRGSITSLASSKPKVIGPHQRRGIAFEWRFRRQWTADQAGHDGFCAVTPLIRPRRLPDFGTWRRSGLRVHQERRPSLSRPARLPIMPIPRRAGLDRHIARSFPTAFAGAWGTMMSAASGLGYLFMPRQRRAQFRHLFGA